MKSGFISRLVIQLIPLSVSVAAAPQPGMVLIPNGQYTSFVIQKGDKSKPKVAGKPSPISIHHFWMDRYPVNNQDFLNFVKSIPAWRKSNVKPIFADPHYLADWKSDLDYQPRGSHSPVTDVSWFAAQAYCESKGKEVPTTDQWEFALADEGRNQAKVREKILSWYGRPHAQSLPKVESGEPNGFGIYNLSGLIWEWTQDFNLLLVGQESIDSEAKDANLFCAGGSQITNDSSNYAAFMRYSFRFSIKASFTTGDLGFRCAKDEP